MADLNIYSSKRKVLPLFILSSLFVFLGIVFRNDMLNFESKPFKSLILILGMLIFVFGIIFTITLFFRKKPLLTIKEDKIIIYNIFLKEKIVFFSDIESFFVVTTNHRGFVTNRQIFIELKKATEEYRKSLVYKFIMKFNNKIANSQYAIQTSYLDFEYKNLLNILNKRLRKNVA